jgi:hypothetical protein
MENKRRFEIFGYILSEGEPEKYVPWSKGFRLIITKDDKTISLNEEEIKELVKQLPRTIGGKY